MDIGIRKRTIWAFLCLFLYRVGLDLSYYYVISPLFTYANLDMRFNGIKLVEGYILFIVVFTLMPKSSRKLSNILIWLLMFASYIPMLTLFALRDESRLFMYAVTVFWIMVFQLLRLPDIHLPTLKHRKVIFYLTFICLSVVVSLLIYVYFGFSVNLNLATIYDFRIQFRETNLPIIGYYLVNWQAYTVNPIFLTVFVMKRKWLYAALVSALQLFLFSSTGSRAFLFCLPYVLLLSWIVTSRKNPLAFLGLGWAGTAFSGILTYVLMGNIAIASLFIRRTLIIPAQLYFLYYDFFSWHGPIFLSSTRGFRTFMNYPYDLMPDNLIAQVYFGLPEMGANTGIVGDAYMNFGLIGLVLWGILLSIILKVIDACFKGKDIRVGVAAIAMSMFTITNSALSTNLSTHGLMLAMIILYLAPKKMQNRSPNMIGKVVLVNQSS